MCAVTSQTVAAPNELKRKSPGSNLNMQHSPLTILRLAIVTAVAMGLAGCVRHEYYALQNGYGYRTAASGLPHSGTYVRLTYTKDGSRRTIWPSTISGCLGARIVHEDLMVFIVDLNTVTGPSHPSTFFAAKDGAPLVEITQAILRAAQPSLKDTGSINFDFCIFRRTGSALTVQCNQWVAAQKRREKLNITITWQEINDLVRQLRTSGTLHKLNGVTYYSQD